MYLTLSYLITADAPTYPGNPEPLRLEQVTAINKNGAVTNMFKFTLFNHGGTHLDGPWHFNEHAPIKLWERPLTDFIYDHPVVIDLEGTVQDKIFPADLEPFTAAIEPADFLLIRTGYAQYRVSDLQRYTQDYPVISKELATYLIEHFPALRGIGIDCISIGSRRFRPDAIAAHQILTGVNPTGRYLFILEDVNLPKAAAGMKKLFVIPLFIEGVDSFPVTVFCEV